MDIISLVKPLTPAFLKEAVKRAIEPSTPQENYFRTCSPATLPELALCLFELQRARLLDGGSYYEFGLFRGYTLWFVHELARRMGIKLHCHGFDSFQGLPTPTGPGDDGAMWKAGDFAVSRARVEKYLKDFGADFDRISLHEGFFSDALFASIKKRGSLGRAALVLIDCDLYSSTVPVLRFIHEYLADGTIILFDDYNCFGPTDDRGQRRALAEFLAMHSEVSVKPLRAFGWHGQGFRVKVTPNGLPADSASA